MKLNSAVGSKLILYADDILLYRPVISDEDLTQLQQDINAVHNWTTQHGLLLNNQGSSNHKISECDPTHPLSFKPTNPHCGTFQVPRRHYL